MADGAEIQLQFQWLDIWGESVNISTSSIDMQVKEITAEGNLAVWRLYYERYKETALLLELYKKLMNKDMRRVKNILAEFEEAERQILLPDITR